MKHSKKHSKTHHRRAGHHKKINRHMEHNKKIISSIIIIFVLIAAAVVYILISTERQVVGEPDAAFEQCASFCETNQRNAFCSVNINVDEDLRATCDELASNSEYAQYNVETCASISCESLENIDQTCEEGLGGTWEEPQSDGTCEQSGEKIRRELTPSDEPPAAGQICCK